MPATMSKNVSNAKTTAAARACQVIPAGAGESYWSVGDLITFKIGAEHSNGALAVGETLIMPGGGPPPHVHTREDEIFYILEGEVELVLGDTTFTAKAGDAIFLPRNVCHTFHNASNAPARMIVMATPCGFENFMREFGLPREKYPQPPSFTPRPEDMTRLLEAGGRYGLQMLAEHKPSKRLTTPRTFRSVPVMGMRMDLKLTKADTNGALSLTTINTPQNTGAPTHSHREQDELFYVERGTFTFLTGDKMITATPGTTVFIPAGIMHNFTCISAEEGRLMNIHMPGGFEEFFIEVSERAPGLSLEQIADLFDRHGMDMPPR